MRRGTIRHHLPDPRGSLNDPTPPRTRPDAVPDGTAATAPRCAACGYARPAHGCRVCSNGIPRLGPRLAPLDIFRGFRLYFAGAWRLINDRTFSGRLGIALVVGAIVLITLGIGVWRLLGPAIDTLLGWAPSWASSASALVLVVITTFFCLPVFLSLILFPVLDPLARLAEEDSLGFAPTPHARGAVADFWDSLDTGARILILQGIAWLACLPLVLLGIGAAIAIPLSAFFAGFAWFDYPASRRGLAFKTKWRVARRHWAILTGYGLGFLVGLLIPFFNVFLAAPAGAIGIADLWFRLDKD